MIDVMGHELRTPISIVRNALLVMHSKFKKDGQVEKETLGKYLEMAVESVRRELTLIETLLSATKVEGNRIQLQFTKVDLIDVVEDSIEALKRDAIMKNLPLNFEKPKQEIFIYADRVRTQEIMDNFLSNAIKYTPKGKIDILIGTDDKFATLRVQDTGIGIAKSDVEKLGKKFFRAQPHYSAEQGARPSGTGLGLYVTFELIDVMNGKRIVESELGKGSTFGFALPLFNGQEDQSIDQTFMADPKLAKEVIDTGVKK
jgi:signal transduction histidine kinase